MGDGAKEAWKKGGSYEQYVGRWSRMVARIFLEWLTIPSGQTWGDVGCGTGALVESILAQCEPKSVVAIDSSEGFLAEARHRISDERVRFEVADASALPWPNASCAATVSGLVLNFVPDPTAMVKEMLRVTQPGGKVAIYVWDYGGGMQMMRYFWDTALEVNPGDAALDEARRFPICQPEPLEALLRDAGLTSVAVRSIDVRTIFQDFDDFWLPFLGMQGPAPTYLASLNAETRDQIRDALEVRLATSSADGHGSIDLTARAWAVQGTCKVP